MRDLMIDELEHVYGAGGSRSGGLQRLQLRRRA